MGCPLFALSLNIENGLKAEWWENRLTGRKLQMGKGDEIEFSKIKKLGQLLDMDTVKAC